uniref:AIG1-type G domain-containing protein n=2 Tax=Sphaeramia orbicularis TaxID=375764 RepID=A0A673B4W6_9TELE
MYTIALFGKKATLKDFIIKKLIENQNFIPLCSECVLGEGSVFKVVSAPDFFDGDCWYPDQYVIDCMALCLPGPHLLILVIDSDNARQDQVIRQINVLRSAFGNHVTEHLVVTLPDIESYLSLNHLEKRFNVVIATTNEKLSDECITWCKNRKPFHYDFRNYSQEVVKRRREVLVKTRTCDVPLGDDRKSGGEAMAPPTRPQTEPAPERPMDQRSESDNTFSIIVLGRTGTGKSASANTILNAANSDTEFTQHFKSEFSSVPVTTKCSVVVLKEFGTLVRVVDTPDFLHEELRDEQEQLKECRKYCGPMGRYVVLLVIKPSRFTEGDIGMLEILETKLGSGIRKNTILLLTFGEQLEEDPKKYISRNANLKKLYEQCDKRFHVFRNKSRNTQQVVELFRKIPNYQKIFPKLAEKGQCIIC